MRNNRNKNAQENVQEIDESLQNENLSQQEEKVEEQNEEVEGKHSHSMHHRSFINLKHS